MTNQPKKLTSTLAGPIDTLGGLAETADIGPQRGPATVPQIQAQAKQANREIAEATPSIADQAPLPREPKHVAWRRLESEGRYAAFCQRKAFFQSAAGGKLGRDESFYRALEEFPPQ